MITNKKILYSHSTTLNLAFFSENYTLSDLLFFDIETTGLSSKTSQVFLIGLIQYNSDASAFEMIQFLAENKETSEEIQILENFCRIALTKNCLVHFNGGSFDLPFLRHRCQALHLSESFSQLPSLDLYRELLKMPAFFRQMPDHKQKSFEHLTKYPRKDKLSGKEMISVFQEYALTKASDAENLLLLHNEDDLRGMLSLTSLGSLKQLFKNSYQITDIQELQEPNLDGVSETKLFFHLSLEDPVPTVLSANAGFCYITVAENSVKIKMPLYEGTLRYFYPDYKNYYYLPFEDEAIHKSVAAYLDSSHRQKATAATCYKKISGKFLYAPGDPNLPLLKENYVSKEHYVLWPFEEPVLPHLHSFLHEIIKTAATTK